MIEVSLIPAREFYWRTEETYLVIALKEVNKDQRHIGIIHKQQKGDPSLLHLEWHCILSNSDLPTIIADDYFAYIPPYIDVERARTIAGLCRQINDRKPEIPYGIVFDQSRFSEDGLLHLGDRSHGLTCATFVIAVFLSAGIDLLKEEGWPHRDEDDVWHDHIVYALEHTKFDYGISDEHIENIKSERGCTRFRPEEVAASLSIEETPADFDYASRTGLMFIDCMRKLLS
jgi:hypothetical protein